MTGDAGGVIGGPSFDIATVTEVEVFDNVDTVTLFVESL